MASHCQHLHLNEINTAIAPVNFSNFTNLKTILISSREGELYHSIMNIRNSNIDIHCTVETVNEHELSTVYQNVTRLTITSGVNGMNGSLSYHLNYPSLRSLHFAKGCGRHVHGLTLGENMKGLEELIIEDDCFTDLAENQLFECKGLQYLRAITIGENSLPHFTKCRIVGRSPSPSFHIRDLYDN